MALGMPIAFALLVCGAALMYQLDMMDAQIIAQNLIAGADSFPLMAAPFFLLAGIVPGILIGAGLAVAWWLEVRKETTATPKKATRGEVLHALVDGVWALALPGIIIFGLKFGIFTPTEAAVVCAVYALFVAMFIYRELKWTDLYRVFVTAAETTAIVMFLVAAALVSAWLITIAELPGQVTALLKPFMDSPMLLMIAMQVLVVLVGTALDMTPTILILTPLLMPIGKAGGVAPIYCGVPFL